MSASFASPDWAASLHDRLQDSAVVRAGCATWIFGPIAFVVDADAEHGLEATALRLDMHEGAVRGLTVLDPSQAALCPFAVGGSLARWKAIFGGALSIVDGVLESKLRTRGDLPTMVRHRQLLDAIAAAAGEVDTAWQDENEPAAATAGS